MHNFLIGNLFMKKEILRKAVRVNKRFSLEILNIDSISCYHAAYAYEMK